MAVTHVHTIHKGAYNAIAYIINPDKTADGRYVISNLCVSTAQGAASQFRETRELAGTGRCRNEAQHIIQSFPPGEVTPERALLIGQELCEKLFGNEYQYVLATHVDKDHVHNHIILNNVNFYTGKTFETEFNQGKIPDRAWSKLRTVSDEICKKHQLAVIEEWDVTKGKSHDEWELDNQGLSWKAKLKYAIDQVVKASDDFEDFLKKCADFGVLVEYNPERTIDLKFMLAEQQERNPRAKFTRARTLGFYYESKQIARRIQVFKYYMNYKPTARIVRTTAEKYLKSQGLTNWADRKNLKTASKALNEMTADNSTLEELEKADHQAFGKRMVASNAMNTIKHRFEEIQAMLSTVEELYKYSPYHKKYKTLTGKEQKKFAKQFSSELLEYDRVSAELLKYFSEGKVSTVKHLKEEMEELQKQYAEKSAEYDTAKKEADRLSKQIQKKRQSQKILDRYIQNEQETKRKKNSLE